MAQIQVRDTHGTPIRRVNIRISEGTKPSDQALFDVFTDDAGNTGWPIPFFPTQAYALHVNFANVNPAYVPQSYYLTAADVNDVQIQLSRQPLSRLRVEGKYFVGASGRVFLDGVTDFLLYKRYLDGEDIDAILRERTLYRFNAVRIIGMVNSFSHWYPQEYGQRYYDALPAFYQKLADYGLYGYFTVFADTEIVMPKQADQVAHFGKVVAQLGQCPNSLGELVNEPYAHENATANPHAFPRPQGVAFSSGSYNDVLGAKVTPPPHWDFHDFHVPRKDVKRVADQCMSTNPNYLAGMAVLSGEPDKFGGPNAMNPKVYLTNPDEARQMRDTARGTACGYIYHTSAGVWSLPWNDVEHRCADASVGRA